ncbi:hypothetical protein [uncultured Shewanella sp.]|uniref:hypothetical protein n=1 Tax=uncultured Shewanella sp. TaxID=173975 RepID=UPI0026239BB4|nr:hypothetical protein [uncultured Shewanella sp.]
MDTVRCAAFTWNTANVNVPKEAPIEMAEYLKKYSPHILIISLQEAVRSWHREFVSQRIKKRMGHDVHYTNGEKKTVSYNPLVEKEMGVITKADPQGIFGYTHLAIYVRSDLYDVNVASRTMLSIQLNKTCPIELIKEGECRDGPNWIMNKTRNKGGLYARLSIFGQPLAVIGAHLDSNKEENRAREVNQLCQSAEAQKDSHEETPSLIFMGDLNERITPFTNNLKTLLNEYKKECGETYFISQGDPLSRGEVDHFKYRDIQFEQLDQMTYGEFYSKTDPKKGQIKGNYKFKEKRGGRPDAGALDNIGIRDNEGRISSIALKVHPLMDKKGNLISDHNGVSRIFKFDFR